MDSAIAPDNVTGAPTYVHPSSMMVKTAASNNATASFNNSDEQPPTADDVSQSNLLLVKELQGMLMMFCQLPSLNLFLQSLTPPS